MPREEKENLEKCASFLRKKLQSTLGEKFDFKLNEEQDSDTDVILLSAKRNLNLQLVQCQKDMQRALAESRKHKGVPIDVRKKVISFDGSLVKWIKQTITQKEAKNYSDPRNLILVTWSDFAFRTDLDYLHREVTRDLQTKFKGVMFICLPEAQDNVPEGYILNIKDPGLALPPIY